MLLKDKVAVIYGGGGAIGGAVARAMAREGAWVFLTGRRAPDAVADEIGKAGGRAEAASVDALDEKAIDRHLQTVIDKAGRVDVSFNAIGLQDRSVLGVKHADLDVEKFSLPILTYTTSYFLTARLAARRMVVRRSGVIMTVSALPARLGSATNGGYGPSQAAKEAMTRDLSFEFAPQGLRVVCLRPHGIPDTETMAAVYAAKLKGVITWEQFQASLANSTHPKRASNLDDLAEAAVFAASDRASGMTGTTMNLTMGALDD